MFMFRLAEAVFRLRFRRASMSAAGSIPDACDLTTDRKETIRAMSFFGRPSSCYYIFHYFTQSHYP
jgi:hypothetical protein